MGDENIWDACSCPTKNMPGYDDDQRWVGMKKWMESEGIVNKEYASAGYSNTNRPTEVKKHKSIHPLGHKHKKGIPKGNKGEPNWSFRKKKTESSESSESSEITKINESSKSNKPSEPSWTFKKKKTESDLVTRHHLLLSSHKEKYKPKDVVREHDDDDVFIKYVPIKYVKVKKQNVESAETQEHDQPKQVKHVPTIKKHKMPNLLRDTSTDTTKLMGSYKVDKSSLVTKKNKNMTLVKNKASKSEKSDHSDTYNKKKHVRK
jgi:hypothetical protein